MIDNVSARLNTSNFVQRNSNNQEINNKQRVDLLPTKCLSTQKNIILQNILSSVNFTAEDGKAKQDFIDSISTALLKRDTVAQLEALKNIEVIFGIPPSSLCLLFQNSRNTLGFTGSFFVLNDILGTELPQNSMSPPYFNLKINTRVSQIKNILQLIANPKNNITPILENNQDQQLELNSMYLNIDKSFNTSNRARLHNFTDKLGNLANALNQLDSDAVISVDYAETLLNRLLA